MSANGDSTRDWLLKKLLKASRSLAEQATEIQALTANVSTAQRNADGWQQRAEEAAASAGRFAERVDDLEFEVQQLKKVPPIAPNLNIYYKSVLGDVDKLRVTSVSSANGQTTIHTEPSRARR